MGDTDDPDREAILRRRSRWLGVALTGRTASTQIGACACLSPAPYDAGVRDAGRDASPEPCLSRPPDDAGLDAGLDAGDLDGGSAPDAAPRDAGEAADGAAHDPDAGDAMPLPCLLLVPRDSGSGS